MNFYSIDHAFLGIFFVTSIYIVTSVFTSMKSNSHPPSPSNPSPNSGGQYFDRRGEVNELKQLLRSSLSERDGEKMRDAIKKVIGYMTLGIDMSRVFSEMVMASQMGDIVQKKMVYLYLTTYAEANADLAILAVNTLQKDTKDVDPSVRGMSLRSLCSLRIENIMEYLEPAIRVGLCDNSGYVRKIAVLGVLQCSKSLIFSEQLCHMLETDSDSAVVANCLVVLKELNLLVVDQKLVYQLLNRFSSFSEWGRCFIIDSVLSLYTNTSSDELYSLMNCLDPYLKQSSIPVSMGIINLFEIWGNTLQITNEVLIRIIDPILTLFSSSCTSIEMQFALLERIAELSLQNPSLFSPNQFFLADFDTLHTAEKKIQILARIGGPAVLQELGAHLSNTAFAPAVTDAFVKMATLENLDWIYDTLIANSVETPLCFVAIRRLLALFPNQIEPPTVFPIDSSQTSPIVGDAIVWILGEFPIYAPQQLEEIFESATLTVALLTAVIKKFFQYPRQTRNLLHKVLTHGIDHTMDPNLRDRALLYFRMLKFGGVEKCMQMMDRLEKMKKVSTPQHVETLLSIDEPLF